MSSLIQRCKIMTLENCKRLLAHYEAASKDPAVDTGAQYRMGVAAKEMKQHIVEKTESLQRKGLLAPEVKPSGKKK